MCEWECPHCGAEHEGTGDDAVDVGLKECENCGDSFRVLAADQKRNDAIERGDELRDRAKDER